MLTRQVAQESGTPRLVQGGVGYGPVAQPFGDHSRVVAERERRVPVQPAALVSQCLGQVPVVQRQVRLQATLQQAIDQSVVEIPRRLYGRAPDGRAAAGLS